MNPSLCHSLDDYLAHDLTGDERERFVAHLADCPDCRRSVAEQKRIDALLAAAPAPVPAGLTETVERRLRRVRRRRVAAVAMALAASVAAIWLVGHTFHRSAEPEPPLAKAPLETPAPETPRPADHVRVTFPASANVFAVPAESASPNVTFLWVFPDLRAAHRPVGDPTTSSERNDS